MIASIAETPEMRTPGRFQRSLLSHAGSLRVAARRRHRRRAAGGAGGKEDRGGRRHRARSLSQDPVHRSRVASLSERGRCARDALQRGEVDLLFGDGIALAFWLNGTDSANCCEFRGGPYLESRFFGEGVGIAVRHGNDLLRQAFNWALFRLWEKGAFTDLWLRYFPISPF